MLKWKTKVLCSQEVFKVIKVLKHLCYVIPLQKLPKNVEDLSKLIAAKGFKKSCLKSNKSPNLVTLYESNLLNTHQN